MQKECVHRIFLVNEFQCKEASGQPVAVKNLRNNWITQKQQELAFCTAGVKYTARWKDVVALYNEDKTTALRVTKLTYTTAHSKILQRQSVPHVYKVFSDKTCAAFVALKNKFNHEEGICMFVRVV